MSVREIPRGEWQGFLDQFSRDHRAWLVRMDRFSPDAERQAEINDRPLGSVTARAAGQRVVAIQIQFQPGSHASDAVVVDAPSHLRLDETPDGATEALEIENERGERTRLELRVATPPGLLDGIAPGEV
jgi:hypothetical protein